MISGIYKWTSPSNKVYIGKSVNLDKRHKQFLNKNTPYTALGSKIDNARNKYSDFSLWKYEVLQYAEIDELSELERYYIEIYDSVNSGYNICLGGEGVTGYTHSDESKEKMRLKKLGKHLSDEHKEHIRQSNKGKETWNKGIKGCFSEKTRKKISEAGMGRIMSDSNKEALNKGRIGCEHPSRWKAIDQFDKDGNYIKTYKNGKEIEIEFGKSARSKVILVCKGVRKTACGYIWRYS